MKKKIYFILFISFFLFIGLEFVSAKVVCEYKGSNKTIEIIFDGSDTPTVNINGKKSDKKVFISNKNKCPKVIYTTLASGDIFDNKDGLAAATPQLTLKESSSSKVYCGNEAKGRITRIPKKIPELTSSAVTIVQVLIPVILVVLGTLDLFKGITAGKEDEIKKGQQMFIKRLVVAAVIFFIVIIVKFLISIIADTNQTNIIDCVDCFIDNDCKEDFSL